MDKDNLRLKDILSSIENIEEFIANRSVKSMSSDNLLKSALMAQLMIIGEAANNISIETKSKNNDIQWKKIIGMRHVLVHEYFGIMWDIIWDTITKDLPNLKILITQA